MIFAASPHYCHFRTSKINLNNLQVETPFLTMFTKRSLHLKQHYRSPGQRLLATSQQFFTSPHLISAVLVAPVAAAPQLGLCVTPALQDAPHPSTCQVLNNQLY